jgi:hypothetical protein
MAKLTITVDENEYALYDFTVEYNGVAYSAGENYTSEQRAIEAAILAGQERWSLG